ncbi:MAG TPA: enoyl-CoA hydratase/isomerase family protein [Thermoanaerobaculia bacterium]|jgi:cyclohexa-1,5-dienecarbonyl-CoA hydratase|nr:enoyl-CoA hydratase/isomerase family protein [Thermoanaerobaculia bacterium]
MPDPNILVYRDGSSATVTLNRPPLNILDIPTISRLGEAIEDLAVDPGLLVIVLRGAGDRAFSAGVAVQDHTPEKVVPMLESLHGTIRRLRDLAAITVAAVQGHCLGGGMELALSCDLVIATDDARFSQPEIELGCYPPVASALLPSRIGAGLTLDLALTGRTLNCEEAERWGLVTRRVPSGSLDEAVRDFVAQITAKSAPVVRLAKKAVRAGRDLPFAEALAETERIYKEELLPLEDLAEGAAAFLEKRRPRWRNR